MLYVLCACPLDVGIVCVFLRLVFLLNVEGVYNEQSLCLIVILLASNLSYDQCLFGEGLGGPPPCIIMVSKLEQLPCDCGGATYS